MTSLSPVSRSVRSDCSSAYSAVISCQLPRFQIASTAARSVTHQRKT